jgi:hypothetical protein
MTAFAAEDYTQWTSYREITVNTTSSGANVAGNVTNFPVLVRLTNADSAHGSNVLAGALAGGADIRFADSTGANPLAYQIERWTASAAEIWVKVPTVVGNGNTKIRMYWGKSGAADSSKGGRVFQASDGYVGVWHMGDASGIDPRPNAVTGAPPATPSNDAGAFGGGSYVVRQGVIGLADTIRGGGTRNAPVAGSDYFNLGNTPGATSSPFDGANTYAGYSDFSTGFTYSFWVRPGTAAGNYTYMLELSNGSNAADNIQFFRPTTATTFRYENTNGGASGGLVSTATGTFVVGTWQYMTVTVGTGATPAVVIYKNGVSSVTGTSNQPLANILRANAWIGKSNYGGDFYFTGAFDEPEIHNVTRSADWVKLSYETQKTGATCVALGSTISLPPMNLVYHPNPAVYTVGYAVPANTPTVSGLVTRYSVSPSLPTGLSLDTLTGVITGTPTSATAVAGYLVTASNSQGSDTETVRITVNASLVAPTNLSYTVSSAVYGVGTAITPNNPTVTGTVTTYSVNPTLPPGLSISASTGVISGTPTAVAAAANYTVTASNSAGNTTAVLNITVIAPPTNLTYSTPSANYAVNQAITANSPTVTGTVTSWSVSPALPAGLSLNGASGVITGTPTSITASKSYTVTAANAAGSTTVSITINVYGPPSGLFYSVNPATYNQNQAIAPNTPSVTGTITRWSVSPALPTGLVLDTLTGIISGTPTTSTTSYADFTVTASNAAGSTTAILTMWVISTTAIAREPESFAIRMSGASPVSFNIPEGASQVNVSILDMWGRTVWSRNFETAKMGGVRQISWNGIASNGQKASAGVYMVRVNILGVNRSSSVIEHKINYTP